jgi:hypothetical protein
MIYIHPIGGLGNMFFHISSIWTLAKDNNDELGLLDIDKKIQDLINDKRGDLKHAQIFKYLFNRFPNKNGNVSNSITYPFKYTALEYKNEFQYVGYFQSEKYFKHRRNEILELLKPGNEFISEIDKYNNLFGNISLHVRRNDYVKLYPEVHPPQTIEYYENALSELPKNLLVVIFSDDLEWCKENFIGDRYVFIDEKDYISIYLMSKMKYHIIANSSFSWWGAWLSEYNNKEVIAPKIWFGEKMSGEDVDLIPKEWNRI